MANNKLNHLPVKHLHNTQHSNASKKKTRTNAITQGKERVRKFPKGSNISRFAYLQF